MARIPPIHPKKGIIAIDPPTIIKTLGELETTEDFLNCTTPTIPRTKIATLIMKKARIDKFAAIIF